MRLSSESRTGSYKLKGIGYGGPAFEMSLNGYSRRFEEKA